MSEEELVRVYRPVVFRFSMRLAGDAAEAEDLTQETLLKALRGLGSFEGRSTAATWLYRIALNTWTNRLRARAARREDRFLASCDGEGVVEPDVFRSAEPGPEALAAAADERRRLARALERLPDDERRVLELRELDGLSYEETAARLSLPLGTVKSRLSRARRLLRAAALPLLLAAAVFTVLLAGVAMKSFMPGVFAEIQGMISGAANTMGSGSR